jgi:hypothetical protein
MAPTALAKAGELVIRPNLGANSDNSAIATAQFIATPIPNDETNPRKVSIGRATGPIKMTVPTPRICTDKFLVLEKVKKDNNIPQPMAATTAHLASSTAANAAIEIKRAGR